jgi:hypothetical protein
MPLKGPLGKRRWSTREADATSRFGMISGFEPVLGLGRVSLCFPKASRTDCLEEIRLDSNTQENAVHRAVGTRVAGPTSFT